MTSLLLGLPLPAVLPFATPKMDPPRRMDSLWAGLCLVGAVYFIFRG